MKKNTIRAMVVAAVLLVVYHLVAFLVPFSKTAVFWISYAFSLIAFGITSLAVYIAFFKNPSAKSRFYGFPIARIGVIYGIVHLIISLVAMVLGQKILWWIPVLVYAIAAGVAIIGLVSAEVVVEEIKTQDATLKKNTSVMRELQSRVFQMAAQTESAEIHALADEFRYSDPVSSDAIAEAESNLAAAVDELQSAIDNGNSLTVQLCRKTMALLAERNRLCKLNKS